MYRNLQNRASLFIQARRQKKKSQLLKLQMLLNKTRYYGCLSASSCMYKIDEAKKVRWELQQHMHEHRSKSVIPGHLHTLKFAFSFKQCWNCNLSTELFSAKHRQKDLWVLFLHVLCYYLILLQLKKKGEFSEVLKGQNPCNLQCNFHLCLWIQNNTMGVTLTFEKQGLSRLWWMFPSPLKCLCFLFNIR